nr:DNRLRE domain-containing protein [uncultured Caproiciproducens sp.]
MEKTLEILAEFGEKRTESTKTFLMSNGTFMMAAYGEAIHFKDSTGTWQDIDNTLSVVDGEATEDARQLENGAGKMKVRLEKRLKNGKAVTLKVGDYSISWELDGADRAESEIIEGKNIASSESPNDQFLRLKKLKNKILYKGALPGVDLQYLITSGAVKENIILKTKDAQSQFTETYQIGTLSAKQKDDRTIVLFEEADSKQETPIYTISLPQISDANGEIGNSFSFSILSQDQGSLKTAIHIDKTWLNEENRAYPITIDPTVFTTQSSSAIQDTFICSGAGYHNQAGINNTMGTMYIGNETTNYKVCRILVKFTLPTFSKGDMIAGAQLNLAQRSDGLNPSSASMQVNAYAMNSAWAETTVTWDNSLTAVTSAISGSILDYFNVSQSTANTFNTWDITKLVKSWYNGTANNGIVLKAADESAAVRNVYYTSNYPDESDVYPTIAIYFTNNAGLEDYWSYHRQSVGRAGTGYINDYSGNLVFTTPIMSTTGERVPLDFFITYNNFRSGTHFKDSLKGDIYGWGWQSNLSQRVDPVSEASGTNAVEKAKFKLLAQNGYRFVYLDEDGTEHYFKVDPNNSARIIDEDGLNLVITSGGAGDEYYTIQYSDGSKKTFTGSGYLYRIYDSEGNYLTLAYYGSFMNQITDGAGRITHVEYSGSGAVTAVTAPDGRQTLLHYIGGNLTSITYPDSKTVQFTYNASNQLQKATNIDGTYVQYSYYDSSNPMVKNRVKDVAEYSATGDIGNKVTFAYNSDNTTTFKYYKAGQTDAQAQQEIYTFDTLGRTTSILKMDG